MAPKDENQTRRDRILKVSKELFYSRGFSEVTMDDIADKLGMSKKTLYKYFEGKLDIITQLVRQFRQTTAEGVNAILDNPDLDYPMKLKKMLNYVALSLSDISPTLVEDLQKNLPELWEELNKHKRESAYERFNKLIEEGREKNLINQRINHRLVVALYASAVQNLLDPAFLSQIPAEILKDLPKSPAAIFDNVINIIYEGILNPDAKERYQGS